MFIKLKESPNKFLDEKWRDLSFSLVNKTRLAMKIPNTNNQTEAPSMVIFLTSLAAYEKMRATILTAQYPVWCASGILTASESEMLYSAGVDLTIFNYEMDMHDHELLDGALLTIREHHGDMEVWLDNEHKI